MIKSLATGMLLLGCSTLALAADNPLSVHVLNLQDGLPSAGVQVTLERQSGSGWQVLNSGTTNAQGRITALYPTEQALEKGVYRVTFKTGDWFAQQKATSFFPEIPVIFNVDAAVPHYHIPLMPPYRTITFRCCSVRMAFRPIGGTEVRQLISF